MPHPSTHAYSAAAPVAAVILLSLLALAVFYSWRKGNRKECCCGNDDLRKGHRRFTHDGMEQNHSRSAKVIEARVRAARRWLGQRGAKHYSGRQCANCGGYLSPEALDSLLMQVDARLGSTEQGILIVHVSKAGVECEIPLRVLPCLSLFNSPLTKSMVKHGGFFKRLKASAKRTASKLKRGTTGRSKEDRIKRHNLQVDIYRTRNELEQLNAISDSSASESESDASDVENPARAKLLKLQTLLGVTNGAKEESSSDFEKDDEIAGEADEELEDEDGDEEAVEEQSSNEGEEEEESDSVVCSVCSTNLDGTDAQGFVCIKCQMTYCTDCFTKNHGARIGHQTVSLQELDQDEALEEDDEGVEGQDGFAADDRVDPEDPQLPEDEYEEEAEKAELPAKLLSSASFTNTKTEKEVRRAVETVIGNPKDPWLSRYHFDSSPPVQDPSSKLLPIPVEWNVPNTWFGMQTSAQASASVEATGKGVPAMPKQLTKPTFLLQAIWDKWLRSRSNAEALSTEEWTLLHCLSNYSDSLLSLRNWENEDSLIRTLLLHCLNHLEKARVVVGLHNHLLRSAESPDDLPELRDRGFGKTRILILLPMRNIALRYAETLVNMLGANEDSCKNLKNFRQDFSEVEEAMDPSFKRRPISYRKQFEGNINDSFCFGLSMNRNEGQTKGKGKKDKSTASGKGDTISFYSHVLNSDILIASPIGLRKRLEKNPDAAVALSSIEICVIDQASVLYMQNWQHLLEVLQLLNKAPKDTTEGLNDISRVYQWAIDGKGAEHRQTIMLSEWSHAAFLSTLRTGKNVSGRFTVGFTHEVGALSRVLFPIRQHFRRFTSQSPNSVDDDRFQFFKEKIVPTQLQQLIDRQVRTIIFVPSYFDYVRVRNFLYANHRESFVTLCEYTPLKTQRRVLGQFTAKEKTVLVMTERFYFFKRYFVKLAEYLIFYSPPLNPQFYWMLVGKLDSKSPASGTLCLYCRFDTHELPRVVGASRAKKMITDTPDAYFFVTDAEQK